MTLFLSKVWNWVSPVGPMQFSTSGWRDNALDKLKPGDLVALVGTKGERTEDEMKGRVLGIMEPTSEPVMSLDFEMERDPSEFVGDEYKWPYGLMNKRAWSLPDRPSLREISQRKFSMDSTQGIVPLTPEEEQRVRAYRWKEEELIRPSAQALERMAKKYGTSRRTAPPPTTTRSGIMHLRREPAYTYALMIEGANQPAIKIGWAFDYRQRAGQFNHASMPELGGLEYKPIFQHRWNTARLAYHMEQHLLACFAAYRHHANNEIVVGVLEEDLQQAWLEGIKEVRGRSAHSWPGQQNPV